MKLAFWRKDKPAPVASRVPTMGKAKPRQRSIGDLLDHEDNQIGLTLNYSANNEIYRYKNAITNKMRRQYWRNPYIKRIVRHTQNQTLGDGFVLRPRFRKRNGELDRALNQDVAEAFRDWAGGHADIQGKMSLRDIEATILYCLLIEGEAFVQFSRHGRYGLALQIIEGWRVDVHHQEEFADTRKVQMGIETNRFGRPLAYHVNEQLHNVAFNAFPVAGRGNSRRINASNMAHIFVPEFPEQMRGLPLLMQSVGRFANLGEYEQSELEIANLHNSRLGFIEKTDPAAQPYTGKDQVNGETRMAADDRSMVEELTYGNKFTPWTSDHPKSEYANFHKNQLQGAATVSGVDYHTVSGDTAGANFSTLRQVNIQQRDLFKDYHALLTEKLRVRVFDRWLLAADAAGMIRLPTRLLENERERTRVRFVQRDWRHVQPREEFAAQETQINNNLKSVSELIEETGRDPDEVFEQIAEEQRKMEELGISRAAVMGATREEDDEDVDEETGEPRYLSVIGAESPK